MRVVFLTHNFPRYAGDVSGNFLVPLAHALQERGVRITVVAPADEGVVPWFYRTLRNAAIDQFRRRGAADRAHEAFARELETHEAPASDMEGEICACVSRLAATLKPEYAEALEAIEVEGTPVKAFAEAKGLSSNNAAVRVFRAREALKKRVTESCGVCAEHGCVNCTCKQR